MVLFCIDDFDVQPRLPLRCADSASTLCHSTSDAAAAAAAAAEISNLGFALAHAANQFKRTESEKALRGASEAGNGSDAAG